MTASTTTRFIIAPNNDSTVDDSNNARVSRTADRVRAKGCGIRGVFTEGWRRCHHNPDGRVETRVWEIEVLPQHEAAYGDDVHEAEIIGTIVVIETRFELRKASGRTDRWVGSKMGVSSEHGGDGQAMARRRGWDLNRA